MSKAAQPYQVLPQRRLGDAKEGLNDQVNRAANLLINRLGINRAGRELINTGRRGDEQLVACVHTHQQRAQEELSETQRNEWRTEQFETATAELEDVLNTLTRRYQGGY